MPLIAFFQMYLTKARAIRDSFWEEQVIFCIQKVLYSTKLPQKTRVRFFIVSLQHAVGFGGQKLAVVPSDSG